MKLYTKTGDDGTTSLFGGQRVDKDHLRVEAYGTVDELNSIVGVARAACDFDDLNEILTSIQNRLFELGADLATPGEGDDLVPRIGETQITELEQWIDRCSEATPELKSFVLPGGAELAARLHQARTVSRRAERVCLKLHREESIGQPVMVYLNRLSDLLFAMARRANHLTGVADVPWVKRGEGSK